MSGGSSHRTTPGIIGILESALYVEDPERSARFYHDLFGFDLIAKDDRLCALNVGGRQVLLLFRKGASTKPGTTDGGIIPPHDGHGRLHMAFAIDASDIGMWEQELALRNIPIESTVNWSEGGRSIYFRDPDNHSIELASPGTWAVY
jgi:catechol 2,3-dioxygenase-like lactoylglutathione lyase family enzyme